MVDICKKHINGFLEVLDRFGKKRILNDNYVYKRHSTRYPEDINLPQMKNFHRRLTEEVTCLQDIIILTPVITELM